MRSKIQKRFLAVLLLLVAGVTAPAAMLLNRSLVADMRELVRASLEREARAIATELERTPPPDYPRWAEQLRHAGGTRVTVIAPGGGVLADSEVPPEQLAQLENDTTRPEVAAALAGSPGWSIRRSVTDDRDLLYVALPVGKPRRLVLRLALPLDQVDETVARANRAWWVAALTALALSLLLGAAFARWLSRPVLAMTAAARAMSRGDFDVHLPPPRDDELGELVRALSTLGAQLAAHIPQLRAEGEKLRTILNGLPEGVALVQRGSITVANPAFGTLIGTRQVEGRRPLEAARVPELAEAIQAAVASGREVEREAIVGTRAVHLQARPLGDPASQQVVVVLLDMTEARRLERLRRDLVANASHELRTPVAAIVAAAETLAGGAASDPEARSTFINILLRHAQRLSRLTNDLLDLSRLEAGFRPRVETLSVHSAVQAVLNVLEARAREKDIVLESQTRKDLAVSADRAAVEQILTNLVDNAIKYTPRGGRVRVSADAKDARVVIGVEDTGPGIPEEHLPRLFERFYRVDEARARELGGTGLGLAIVKHLVLAHGGEVVAQSQLGSGSRFLVWLPRA